MVLIGGLDPTEASAANALLEDTFNGSADPWAQGLGVFDMTALQWKSNFEVGAGAYMPADIIKNYYNSNK